MMRNLAVKTLGLVAVGVFGAGLFPATAMAETSNPVLPPETAAQLSIALSQLSASLNALQVRAGEEMAFMAQSSQQLGLIGAQLSLLQNPVFLDTEAEKRLVGKIIEADTKIVSLMKQQNDLIRQENATTISVLFQLTQKFQSLNEVFGKLITARS